MVKNKMSVVDHLLRRSRCLVSTDVEEAVECLVVEARRTVQRAVAIVGIVSIVEEVLGAELLGLVRRFLIRRWRSEGRVQSLQTWIRSLVMDLARIREVGVARKSAVANTGKGAVHHVVTHIPHHLLGRGGQSS